MIHENALSKTKAIVSLIKLTDKDPIFFPADSKAIAVIVQKKAVIRAANSP
jgi:hypothetical protein